MAGEGKHGTDTTAEKSYVNQNCHFIVFVFLSDCSKRERSHFHFVELKARRVNMTQEKMPLIQASYKTPTILY